MTLSRKLQRHRKLLGDRELSAPLSPPAPMPLLKEETPRTYEHPSFAIQENSPDEFWGAPEETFAPEEPLPVYSLDSFQQGLDFQRRTVAQPMEQEGTL